MRITYFAIAATLLSSCTPPTQPAPAKTPLFYESDGDQTYLKAHIDRSAGVIKLSATITNLSTRPLTLISHPHFYTLTLASTALSSDSSTASPMASGPGAQASDIITLSPGQSHQISHNFPYRKDHDGLMLITLENDKTLAVHHRYLEARFRYEMFAERLPTALPSRAQYQVEPLSADILFPVPD